MAIRCTYNASVRASGAAKPLVDKDFRGDKASAERWLDRQREIAKRAGWGGLTFEVKENCSSTKGHR